MNPTLGHAETFESSRLGRESDCPHVERIGTDAEHKTSQKRGGYIFLREEVGRTAPVQRFRRGLNDGDAEWFSVTGLFGGVVFGYGTVEIRELSTGELMGVLHDFVVEPDARDVGIGEAMMDLIVKRLRERDSIGVDAWALPGDRATKNFFESFGLKARLLTAHRRF